MPIICSLTTLRSFCGSTLALCLATDNSLSVLVILENGVSEESLKIDVLDLVIGQLCLILYEELLGWAHGPTTATWLPLRQSCIDYPAVLGAP